jgi:hypothetical protein
MAGPEVGTHSPFRNSGTVNSANVFALCLTASSACLRGGFLHDNAQANDPAAVILAPPHFKAST